MRKNFLSMCIVIACCVGMVGCSNDNATKKWLDERYPVLKKAFDKTNQVDNAQGNVGMDLTMRVEGQEMGMSMDLDFEMENMQDLETMLCKMSGTVSSFGSDMPVTYYIKDGEMYMDTMEQKMKVTDEATKEQLTKQMELETITKNQIEAIREDKKEGNTIFTVELNEDEVAGEISRLLGSDFESTLGVSEYDLEMHNFVTKYVINPEGYIISQDMSFTMTMDVMGESASADVSAYVNYTGFEKQEIIFPDFSEYVEATTTY